MRKANAEAGLWSKTSGTRISRGGYAGKSVRSAGCRLQHQGPTSDEVGMWERASVPRAVG
jgi:hypothetical protein